jgi:hypothetical protein
MREGGSEESERPKTWDSQIAGDKMLESLADLSTPSGQTPRQIDQKSAHLRRWSKLKYPACSGFVTEKINGVVTASGQVYSAVLSSAP